MRILQAFVVIALLALFQGEAGAQTRVLGTLNKRVPTVSQVMERAGCRQLWLSQVLLDSRIDPANLHALSVGQRVVFSGRSCRTAPPSSVRESSLAIVKGEIRRDETEALRAELATSREENKIIKAQAETAAGVAKATIDALSEQLNVANSKIEEMPAGVIIPRKTLALSGLSVLGIGFAFGAFAGYFLMTPRERKGMVSYKREVAYPYEGKVYHFEYMGAVKKDTDGSVEPIYRHTDEGCEAEGIFPRNFERHAHGHFLKEPPEVRVQGRTLNPNRSEA